jgi:hypothetical protein
VVESSLDGDAWTEIDRKTDNEDFKKARWRAASFAVSNSGECRFIRLTQTGKCHHENDELVIDAFAGVYSIWPQFLSNSCFSLASLMGGVTISLGDFTSSVSQEALSRHSKLIIDTSVPLREYEVQSPVRPSVRLS